MDIRLFVSSRILGKNIAPGCGPDPATDYDLVGHGNTVTQSMSSFFGYLQLRVSNLSAFEAVRSRNTDNPWGGAFRNFTI